MFNGYETEEEYLDSLKQEDSYTFYIPFEYIENHHEYDDDVDWGQATMIVDVDWDESQHGYVINYYCPDEDKIDPDEGNGSIDEIYEDLVESEVMEELESVGITATALVFGDGR